jgi:hypothetical protein
MSISRGGMKASYWTRNRDWIAKNVSDPIDYIQVDHERLRLDGMEWGVNTAELENLRRLTPDVFRREKGGAWHVQYDLQFPPMRRRLQMRAIASTVPFPLLLRKQQHTKAKRWPRRDVKFDPPTIYLDAPVFEKASQDSNVVHHISSDYEYSTRSIVTGFKPDERYYTISRHKPSPGSQFGGDFVFGFLLVQPQDDV